MTSRQDMVVEKQGRALDDAWVSGLENQLEGFTEVGDAGRVGVPFRLLSLTCLLDSWMEMPSRRRGLQQGAQEGELSWRLRFASCHHIGGNGSRESGQDTPGNSPE